MPAKRGGGGAACTHQPWREQTSFRPASPPALSRLRQRPFTRSLLPVRSSGMGDWPQAEGQAPGQGRPLGLQPGGSPAQQQQPHEGPLPARRPSLRGHTTRRRGCGAGLPAQRGHGAGRGPHPSPPPPSLTGTYRRGAGGRPPPPPLLPPSNGCSGGAAPSPPRPAWPRPQRRRRHFNLPRRPLCSRRSPMMRPLPAPSRSRPPASPPLITLRSDARTRAAPPPAPALGLAYRPHLLRARTIWRTGAEKRRPGRMPQVLEEGAAFRAGLFRWASSLGGLKETDGCRGERESPHVRPSRPVFPPQGARSSTAGERLPPLPGRSRCWVLPHARAL